MPLDRRLSPSTLGVGLQDRTSRAAAARSGSPSCGRRLSAIATTRCHLCGVAARGASFILGTSAPRTQASCLPGTGWGLGGHPAYQKRKQSEKRPAPINKTYELLTIITLLKMILCTLINTRIFSTSPSTNIFLINIQRRTTRRSIWLLRVQSGAPTTKYNFLDASTNNSLFRVQCSCVHRA